MSCNIENCTSVIGILCKSCDKRVVFCLVHGHSHHIESNHQVILLNKELTEKIQLESSLTGKEREIFKITEKIYLIISELKKLLKDKMKEVKCLSPFQDGDSHEINFDLIIDMLVKMKILPDFKKEIELKNLEIEGLQYKLNDCTKNHSCIPDMEKKIKELEYKIEENIKLISRIPNNDGKLTDLEAKIEYCIKMAFDIPKLETQIKDLEEKITNLESNIMDLEAKVENCRKNHSNYSTDIQKYIEEINKLKAKLDKIEELRKIAHEYDEEKRKNEERRKIEEENAKIEAIRNEAKRI